MLTHRPVQKEDVYFLCQFPQSAEELFFLFPKATYPLTPEQLQDAIDQRFDSTVVLWEGLPAGFANFYICKPGEECHIGNVIVDPQVRGVGIGKYLIQTMIDTAFKKHKVREVHISCFHRNVAGLLLYAKLGFKAFAIEERTDYEGQRVALIKLKMCTQAE
jgi:ribosomal protein S18 acetylase RimI-like enzyme